MFAEGISKVGELIDLGVEKKILEKSGAWYSFNGERLGQGREAVKEFLKANPAVAKDIGVRVRETVGLEPKAGDKKVEGRPDEKRPESRGEEKRSFAGKP